MTAPLILGTNSIKDEGYVVDNSCRFEVSSSDSLTRTPSSAGNRKTFTISVWFKISKITDDDGLIFAHSSSGSNDEDGLGYRSDGEIFFIANNGSDAKLVSNAKHRDFSSWYHWVVAVDTTQGTASNRVKIYKNGTQVTSFSTETYPSQDYQFKLNNTVHHSIGENDDGGGTGNFFSGYMAEVVMIDGQQLDPTSFGEFDSDTNIWKPIDVSGLTFGTNGFYLDFEDSSALGNDVSGNNNDFTVNNLTSIDQTTDTCTNNFCTLNPLVNQDGSFSLSQGNLQFLGTGGNDHDYGTLAVQGSGKWYFEVEFDNANTVCYSGFADLSLLDALSPTSAGLNSFIGMYRNDNTIKFGTPVTSQSSSNGDIFGFALNLDASSGSKTVIVQKNGTTLDTITIPTANENNFFVPIVGDTSSSDGTLKCNFGNPIETVSSGNSDAEGFGNFEYSPTIGGVNYLALCTKNLAEYG